MYNILNSRRRSAGLLPLLALSALAVSVPASAQTVIQVGSADANNPVNIPFGTGGQYSQGSAREYEQLYSGTVFSGPVSINTISFSSATGGTVEAANYNISVYLSNTTKTDATLTNTFSQNYGTNRKLVYNGPLAAALTASNTFDLNIPIVPNTFVFNSAAASGSNLLFDVFINADSGTNNFEFFQGTSSVLTESAFDANYPNTPNDVTADGGLLTRFTVTPAPEPSSLVAMALGIAGAGALIARKRRQGISA